MLGSKARSSDLSARDVALGALCCRAVLAPRSQRWRLEEVGLRSIRKMSEEWDRVYVTPLGEPNRDEVAAFWARYLHESGVDPSLSAPPAWCFGDTVELADELIELVVGGPKRATAGTVAEYEAEGEPLPVPGDLSIATDGSMRPRAVLETTEVRVGPLSSVDEQFAWDEGEGDRTRDWWLDAHTWAFTRAFARLGLQFRPHIPVVFERFVVRYQEDSVDEG